MATEQSCADYVLDQLSSLRDVFGRKMFGEYALYHKGKVVALICDNTLYIKNTGQGELFVGENCTKGFPFPGAKLWLKISDEQIEDSDWLVQLVQITEENMPVSKPRFTKKIKS
jgi:DNA transformation protein